MALLRGAGKNGMIAMQDYIRRILTSAVYEVAEETPLEPMRQLSAKLGAPIGASMNS